MNRRVRIFFLLSCACMALTLLASVAGSRHEAIRTFYPEPDFSGYAEDISSYGSGTEMTTSTQPSRSSTVTVNINTATAQELAAILPGIGEVKAQSIVDYREAVGGFNSIDELVEVSGIGEATLERIRPYCVV